MEAVRKDCQKEIKTGEAMGIIRGEMKTGLYTAKNMYDRGFSYGRCD